AVSALQKYMVKNPLDPRAFNNLATIFMLQGEAESALRFVQRAVTLDHKNAAFPYNLSKIYRAKFDFAQAQQKMDEALAINPQQVRNFEASTESQLVDVIPETSLVWQKIRYDNQPFWNHFANPFSLLSASFIVLTFALYALRGRKIGYARRCTQCGKAFCHKCQSSGRAYDLCAQCMHIFILKDGVSPASRREKMQEIDRYSRRQRMLLSTASLLVPGVGDLMRNRTARGFFILALWTLLLILLFFYFRPAFGSYDEPGHNDKALVLVYLVGMALIYLFANLGGTKAPQRAWPPRSGPSPGLCYNNAMALHGTLEDFSLADIFQLVGIQRKTGILTLKNSHETITIFFHNGMIIGADTSPKKLEDRLGKVLVKTG